MAMTVNSDISRAIEPRDAPGISYAVDLQGQLAFIEPDEWTRFALENERPALADIDALMATPLASYLDQPSSVLLSTLLQLADEGQAPTLTYDFRCDAPALEREMRMEISTLQRHGNTLGLLFRTTLLAKRTRDHISILDSTIWTDPALPILRMCSYCKRVAYPEGGATWISATDYEAAGGSGHVRISHGICPQCERDIVEPLLALTS